MTVRLRGVHLLMVALLTAAGCSRSGFEQLAMSQRAVDPTVITSTSYSGASRFGGTGADQSWSVAADGSGNVLIAGSFSSSVDFGDGPRVSAGGTDGFVASFTAAGALGWVVTFGGAGDDEAREIAVDASGVTNVIGTTSGSVDLGCGPTGQRGTRDILLARLGVTGGCVFSRVFGAAGASNSGAGVVVGPGGETVIAASIAAATDFGGGPVNVVGLSDAVAVRFDSSGVFSWARTVGSTTGDFAAAIAVDSHGDVIFSGSFTGQASCAGSMITPGVSGRDVFLAAYEAGGANLWCKNFSPTDSASASGLATDTLGNIYLSGDFIGTVDLGGGTLANGGNTDAFIASYTPAGAHRWSRSIGGPVSDHINDVIVDADVVLWLVGYFALSVDFGSSHLVSNGSLQDVGVLAMETGGDAISGWSFGGTAYDFAYSVALAGGSCIEVTGRTDGDVDFGGGVLSSHGAADAFLLELCW